MNRTELQRYVGYYLAFNIHIIEAQVGDKAQEGPKQIFKGRRPPKKISI